MPDQTLIAIKEASTHRPSLASRLMMDIFAAIKVNTEVQKLRIHCEPSLSMHVSCCSGITGSGLGCCQCCHRLKSP